MHNPTLSHQRKQLRDGFLGDRHSLGQKEGLERTEWTLMMSLQESQGQEGSCLNKWTSASAGQTVYEKGKEEDTLGVQRPAIAGESGEIRCMMRTLPF